MLVWRVETDPRERRGGGTGVAGDAAACTVGGDGGGVNALCQMTSPVAVVVIARGPMTRFPPMLDVVVTDRDDADMEEKMEGL